MRKLLIILICLLPSTTKSQNRTLPELSYPRDSCPEWSFLIEKIDSHQIVALGEESHWVETYLEIKNGLIKSLHQKGGFNRIIFESGFINAFVAKQLNLKGDAQLGSTLYTIWQTKAVQDLFRYIENSQEQVLPIQTFGCDVKGPKSFEFSQFIKQIFDPVNPLYAEEMRKVDSNLVELRFEWEPEIGKAFKGVYMDDKLYQGYQKYYTELIANTEKFQIRIMELQQMSVKDMEYFKRCLLNRKYLLELMQLPSYQEKHHFRDEKMAENIDWLINYYAPDNKYIIWGADIHLSKNAQWESLGEEWQSNQSMTEQLIASYQYQLFSIGIKPIKRLEKSLRHDFKKSKGAYFYIDLKDPQEDSFKTLSTEHDGLILCRKTKSIDSFKLERISKK